MTTAQLELLLEFLTTFAECYDDAIGALDHAAIDISRNIVTEIIVTERRARQA